MRTTNDSGSEPDDLPENLSEFDLQDPQFERQVQRLHQLTVYGRWLLVGLLWLTIAPLCLWHLRSEFALWHDYFTWTAVRYSLAYNRFATAGLAVCIGMTISTLIWQSRNLLWKLPASERKRLERQVLQIRRKGKRHILWKWVCSP
ncbi:hypothetical protein [Leptolyngbya ohadii]|uniref:hypothetical protein n=1 Tax=Leptolyngbya ohadii TaxID=1962290 RepID=UPI001CEDC03B|nr:hypothetical protein [Leptolyngbya ohadii]